MHFPIILAHGALGPFDELIMLGVAVVFLVLMGVSWVKSRNTRPDFESQAESRLETPDAQDHEADAPDRFRLD